MKLFINIENIKEVCGIYSIQNIHNNKRYIGQSKNIKKRVLSHHIYDYENIKNECYNNKFYQVLRKTLGKLSKDSVLDIKNDYQTGDYTYKQLSIKYQTSISNIGKIINYQLYKNI